MRRRCDIADSYRKNTDSISLKKQEIHVKDLSKRLAAITILTAGTLIAASCSSDKKGAPDALEASTGSSQTSNSKTKAGEAGGTEEQTFSVSVRVTAIDHATRQLTLLADDGSQASFIAGPEIRNFDQILVGDKVTATVKEKLTVFVS